jgi:hypothetical protein
MSLFQRWCDSTSSTDTPMNLVLRLSNSPLARGEGAQFGRAHRREVLGVREEDAPAVAQPVVEVDGAFGGLRREVRGLVAESNRHELLLVVKRCQSLD